jgi:hypothetical protein
MRPETANLVKQLSISFLAGMAATSIYNRTIKEQLEAQTQQSAPATSR